MRLVGAVGIEIAPPQNKSWVVKGVAPLPFFQLVSNGVKLLRHCWLFVLPFPAESDWESVPISSRSQQSFGKPLYLDVFVDIGCRGFCGELDVSGMDGTDIWNWLRSDGGDHRLSVPLRMIENHADDRRRRRFGLTMLTVFEVKKEILVESYTISGLSLFER